MVDPPPVDATGLPQPVGDPPQPLQPVLPLPVIVHDQSRPAMDSGRPPLADMSLNGDPPLSDLPASGSSAVHLPGVKAAAAVFEALESQATAKFAPSPRPSVVAPHRKIKKMKIAAKSHPYQPLPTEDSILQKSREAAFDVHDTLGQHGRPAVVQPLQSVDTEDAPLSERDDSIFSDDEDDFDFEEYILDENKRVELKGLMEKYDVYDEEQLRLAIRRERLHEKSIQSLTGSLAGNPLPLPDSAPASPSHIPSKYIPPLNCGLDHYHL